MPKGYCPPYLYFNPHIDKPLEEIWEDIQGYTSERFLDDDENLLSQASFCQVLPPLQYKNKFLKGLYYSNGVDCIHNSHPEFKEKYISMAISMWSSYPWSKTADAYLTCFDYPERNEWFKKRFPEKADKILIPLQDADFTNEYLFAPQKNLEKDIDILCVSQLAHVKNLPILVKALIIFEKKYGYIPKTTLITGNTRDRFGDIEKDVIKRMVDVAGDLPTLKKYINFIGYTSYGKNIAEYYTRAKCCVLTSIFEGKNRMINEAVSCNTPVVVFKNLCQYTRGNDDVFPPNSGIYCEYNEEALADSLHYMIENYTKFTPRESYLKHNGRINFVNKCIDLIPYYRENIPDYEPTNIQNNNWINQAFKSNYQLSFVEYLFS